LRPPTLAEAHLKCASLKLEFARLFATGRLGPANVQLAARVKVALDEADAAIKRLEVETGVAERGLRVEARLH
jgi:hypothetical protein